MVLVGLGILFASLTFLVLRNPRFRWREAIDIWRRGKEEGAGGVLVGQHDAAGGAAIALKGIEGINEEQELSGSRTRKTTDGAFSASELSPSNKETGDLTADAQSTAPNVPLTDGGSFQGAGTPPALNQHAGKTIRGSTTSDSRRPLEPSPKPDRTRPTPAPSRPVSKPQQPANLLMPPPPRASALRALPTLANSLQPPPSRASTLRLPPSTPSAPSTPASSSTLPPPLRPSRKVILPPGHSPLDWAHLTHHPPTPTFLRGAAVPPHLIRVTPSRLRLQNGRKGRDAWGTWQGKVYNLTPYLAFHPGGKGELMRGAGRVGEAERLFGEVHPWVNWEGMLGECVVGIMVGESEGEEAMDLEAMD